MKKIFIWITPCLLIFYNLLNAQETDTIYSPNELYATGYVDGTTKKSGVINQGEDGFIKIDLSDIPKHATITSVDFYYQVGYTSCPGGADADASMLELSVDPATATATEITNAINNASTVLATGKAENDGNYGAQVNSFTLNATGVQQMQDALNSEWISFTIDFNSYVWQVIGYDVPGSEPYMVVDYTPGTPVSNVTISSVPGDYNIDQNQGTLQLNASTEPANATVDSITWSVVTNASWATVDPAGLVTATGEGNGEVLIKAMAWDGSGVYDSVTVNLSNQSADIQDNHDNNVKIYPNPAKELVHIVRAFEGLASVKLINQDGVVIETFQLSSGDKIIDLGDFKPGLYQLLILQNNNCISTKLMIQ